jgi:hypothetical protein
MKKPVKLGLAILGVGILLGACATPAPNSKPTAPPSDPPPPAPTQPTTESTPSGQTSDERRAVIDKKLDGTLGTFDETLRKEQEAVAREQDADADAAENDPIQNKVTKHQLILQLPRENAPEI